MKAQEALDVVRIGQSIATKDGKIVIDYAYALKKGVIMVSPYDLERVDWEVIESKNSNNHKPENENPQGITLCFAD